MQVVCRKCGKDIPDGSKFCMLCGAKQEAKAQSTKSRGNGQGTAIKRGNTWTAIWTVETFVDSNDKYRVKRKSKGGFKTKREALAYAAHPATETPKSPTLRAYWDGWKSSDMLDLSKSKQTAFNVAWAKLDALAGKQMAELTINDLQSTVDQKADTYYPAKDMKTLLSHMYKRAVAEGNARTNLAEFIRLPPLEEKEMQPFTEAEISALWTAYGAGDSFLGFVLLMIYSGMRPGELFRLKVDMIDWDTCEIIGCGTKTKKGKQTPIVFPDMIAPVLASLVEQSKSKVGYVLCMNRDRFYDEYHAAIQRAGVRDLPPYSCRHTTATALALGNIAPSVIQEVMRHTKFSTTQRYIHPDSASAHAAINTMKKGR